MIDNKRSKYQYWPSFILWLLVTRYSIWRIRTSCVALRHHWESGSRLISARIRKQLLHNHTVISTLLSDPNSWSDDRSFWRCVASWAIYLQLSISTTTGERHALTVTHTLAVSTYTSDLTFGLLRHSFNASNNGHVFICSKVYCYLRWECYCDRAR